MRSRLLAIAMVLALSGCTFGQPPVRESPDVSSTQATVRQALRLVMKATGSSRFSKLEFDVGAGASTQVSVIAMVDGKLVEKIVRDGAVLTAKDAPIPLLHSGATGDLGAVDVDRLTASATDWLPSHCTYRSSRTSDGIVHVTPMYNGRALEAVSCSFSAHERNGIARIGNVEVTKPTLLDVAADVRQLLGLAEAAGGTDVQMLTIQRRFGPAGEARHALAVTFGPSQHKPDGGACNPSLQWGDLSGFTVLTYRCLPTFGRGLPSLVLADVDANAAAAQAANFATPEWELKLNADGSWS